VGLPGLLQGEFANVKQSRYVDLLPDFYDTDRTNLTTWRSDTAKPPRSSPICRSQQWCSMLMKNLLSWRPSAWGDVHDVISDNSLSGNLALGSACLSFRILHRIDTSQANTWAWKDQLKIQQHITGPSASRWGNRGPDFCDTAYRLNP